MQGAWDRVSPGIDINGNDGNKCSIAEAIEKAVLGAVDSDDESGFNIDISNDGWKGCVRKWVRQAYQNKWQEDTQKVAYLPHKTEPDFAPYWYWRRGASVMFNILAGSLRTAELQYKLKISADNTCACGEVESIEHFLLKCPFRVMPRRKLSLITHINFEEAYPEVIAKLMKIVNEKLTNLLIGDKIGELIYDMWEDRQDDVQEQITVTN